MVFANSHCVNTQSMKVLFAQSCPALRDPMDYSLPGSSVHGILQERTLEWAAMLPSRGSSQPGDPIWVSCIVSIHCQMPLAREVSSLLENHSSKALKMPTEMYPMERERSTG